jgi:phosphonopyruvate decarboxylase/sulfopyruvate decarboxylase subunit beta
LLAKLSRRAAMEVAVKQLGAEPLVSANGHISRDAFSIADRPQNFYMIGSMGLAAAIGLGLALGGEPRADAGAASGERPRTTVVFDGDGNLLMSLGILGMIGDLAPRNLVHCVFDNEVYGSTGGQRSPSRRVRLDRVAAAAGFRTAVAVAEPDDVAAALRQALESAGPHFVLVKVTAEEAPAPRIPYAPPAMRDRFRAALPPA